MTFPGPPALGRGVVVLPGAGPRPEGWPVVTIDDHAAADPRPVADVLHDLWLQRRPVVIELAADADVLRAPENHGGPVYALSPEFEFSRERLQYLVWSNTYDARADEPVWWHGRRAVRLGAVAGGDADVVLPGGTAAWCDGGPCGPVPGLAVVHRDTIEQERLTLAGNDEPRAELAADQLVAVAHGAGPARVIAPAGSGKTRVLTERLRHLVIARRVARETVTAVAYNTRAADELRKRVASDGLATNIRTLNSLALAIVNGTGGYRAGGDGRRVIDEPDVRRIIDSLVEVRHAPNTDPLAAYIEGLSTIRLGLHGPKEVEAVSEADGLAECFERYREVLQREHLLDFDEQVYRAIEVLLADPDARRQAQRRSRHLLVDEFQDLTPAHVLLLRLISAPTYDVFGVGDDDQTIYGYAGADPKFLIDYAAYFPGATEYSLEVNYRCPSPAVEQASMLMSYNQRRIPKRVRPRPDATGAVRVERVDGARLASATLEHMTRWREQGAAFTDVAVLARVNSALLPVQVRLAEAGIPHRRALDGRVLERTGTRAALAYLRIGLHPARIAAADVADTIRRPSRRIPRDVVQRLTRRPYTSLAEIRRLAETYADDLAVVVETLASGNVTAALRAIRVDIGLSRAMDVLDSSRAEADRSTHGDDLQALEQVAALHPDPATFEAWLRNALDYDTGEAGVELSTVHRVKGREWPYVVVFGATAGLMPHRLAADGEEERRVFHVALTRASREVVVLADGQAPSPFCDELTGTRPRRVQPPVPKRESSPRRTTIAEVGLQVRVRGTDGEVVETGPHGAVLAVGAAQLVVTYGTDVEIGGRRTTLVAPPAAAPDAGLEAALRNWRRSTAARDRVPAYVVLSDEHLTGIAAARPRTLVALSRCKGIGPTRLDRYGDEILAVVDAATA